VCADVNNALQSLACDEHYTQSEQHKDITNSRQNKDVADTRKMVAFLNERNSFQAGDNSLHSIASGKVAINSNVNIDYAV
jgi:hypothetical protein